MSHPTTAKLRAMSDGEIEAAIDSLATHTVVGTGFYVEELARRRSTRADESLDRLTRQLVTLTRVLVAATVLITICTVVTTVVVITH